MANKNPPDNTGKKYNVSEFTPKQEKFIDIYCSKYGKYSAAECARLAGYEAKTAYSKANELLNWKKNPHIRREIDNRLSIMKENWLIDKDRHLSNLKRIGDAAEEKGLYGVSGKMEELRGKVQGFYVEKQMLLKKELTEEELEEKIKQLFENDEEYNAANEAFAKKIFPKEDKDKS